MKQSDMYMKNINYTQVFDKATYYESDSKGNLLETGNGNLRRIDLKEECGEGVIIGQTMKREGIYHKGYSSPFYIDESEPSWLEVTNTITFWKVLVGFNKIILVPKSNGIIGKLEKNTKTIKKSISNLKEDD